MIILLADFGSTFVKYSVYDTAPESFVLKEKIPFPEPCINDGIRFEVSAEDINRTVFRIFDIGAEYSCKRAFISVQMHGFLLRSHSGAMTDYVSWRDLTGNTAITDIDLSPRGTSKKANLPFIKLLSDNRGGSEFYTLGSYIVYLLTGNNITHKSDGCASGFYDASTLEPYDSLGLTLPALTNSVVPAGKYKEMTVFTPIGDHQASYLGSDAGTDAYLINIGTATQISCLGSDPCDSVMCESRPYVGEGRLITVTGLTGGDKLYRGEGADALIKELKTALAVLPGRNTALIGGGGRTGASELIEAELSKMGIACRACADDIGTEGLRRLAVSARTKIGTMLSEAPFTSFPIILKNAGIDFFIIDCEHGAFDFHTLSELITKAKLVGIKAIVRIGDNRREYITKLADMGASGFLLSMTNAAEDIKAVVRYAKYSPVGKRGISTTRAHTLYNPPKLSDYMVSANREMKIYAQIETAEAVNNANEILSVPGVDGVFIGPNDLSDDLGCIGNNEPVKVCISKVSKAAEAAGKPWGIITANRELIDCSTALGVNMISRGSELNMLIDGCKKLVGDPSLT